LLHHLSLTLNAGIQRGDGFIDLPRPGFTGWRTSDPSCNHCVCGQKAKQNLQGDGKERESIEAKTLSLWRWRLIFRLQARHSTVPRIKRHPKPQTQRHHALKLVFKHGASPESELEWLSLSG
jgi:hypothetical protein